VALTIVQAVMMVAAAVVVSTQATSIRAANLLASFIVIPAAFLIQWEAMVMFWGNFDTLWWVVFGVLILTILLVRIGLAHFRREELLGREIDVFRLAWSWRVFWNAFNGGAKSVKDWYRQIIPLTMKRLLLPSVLVLGIVVAGAWIGVKQVDRFPNLMDQERLTQLSQGMGNLQEVLPVLGARSFALIWWQNVRTLLISMIIGVFTFGVVGVLPVMVTMGIAGYLMAMLARSGMAVLPVVVGLLLPHGIIEIPAAILATAAVLHAGAALATPDTKRTVGEVWLAALADWAKMMVGVVIPLLFVAAAVEVWVTPRIAALMLVH